MHETHHGAQQGIIVVVSQMVRHSKKSLRPRQRPGDGGLNDREIVAGVTGIDRLNRNFIL